MDLLRPTSGEARVFGLDCQRESVAVRRLVGYLPGELALYDNLNGRELLAYVAQNLGTIKAAIAQRRAAPAGAD